MRKERNARFMLASAIVAAAVICTPMGTIADEPVTNSEIAGEYIDESETKVIKSEIETALIKDEEIALNSNNGSALSMPVINEISNVPGGMQIKWSKSNGAYKYRVYVKSNDSWNKIGESFTDTFVYTGAVSSRVYTFTVSAVNKDATDVSAFDKAGKSASYIKDTTLTSIRNVEAGVEIKWNVSPGADSYKIYRKAGNGAFQRIAQTASRVYVDKSAKPGTTYTYAVRGFGGNPRAIAGYKSTKTITFISQPSINKFENTLTGTTISWSKSEGAIKYRVYVGSGTSWKRIAEVKGTSYTYDKLTHNTVYRYTVSAVSSNECVSGYDNGGWTTVFIAPTAIKSVTKANTGNNVSWNKVSRAASYYVYRKTFGGSWERIAINVEGTSYNDVTAKSGTLYAYTVRCVNEFDRLISYYKDNKQFYYNGALANGTISVNGKKLFFKDGIVRSGFVKIGGKTYYYNSDGNLEKNGIVGSDKEGYYYADKSGAIDYSYRNGVTSRGCNWIVISGKAYKTKNEKDETFFRALKVANDITNSSMTQAQKLNACFEWVRKKPYIRYRFFTGPSNWTEIYANDHFLRKGGTCHADAAALAYLARAIGYKNVYACLDAPLSNPQSHAWTEIDGRVYDPLFIERGDTYKYYGGAYKDFGLSARAKFEVAVGY